MQGMIESHSHGSIRSDQALATLDSIEYVDLIRNYISGLVNGMSTRHS